MLSKIILALVELAPIFKTLLGRLIKTPQQLIDAGRNEIRERTDKFRRTGRPTWTSGRK